MFVEIIAIASAMGWAGDSILVRFGLRKSNIFAAMLVSYAVSVAFLQVLHVFLAFFEAPSFFLGYLAFFDAPFDTLILLFLPLIDARRGLRERVYRHCSPPAARSAPNVFLQLCVINAVAGSSGSFGCPASSCFSM